MANKTVNTDTTIEALIAAGLADGQNITINSGAVVTCDRTPSALIGQIVINDGKLLITSPVVGNVTNFVGEWIEEINSNGQGVFEVQGGWYSLGTTNGTSHQVITVGGIANSYFGTSFIDVIPGIWIETGRRINYVSGTGILPVIDDWIYLNGSKDPIGRIVQVNDAAGYLVVKFLMGSIVNGDTIAVRRIVDNVGPDFQEIWTATTNGADVLEPGIYQEFGNCVSNNTDTMTTFGNTMGGFIFTHLYQSNTLTLGGTTGGWTPPSGCNIRIPNVHFSTSDLTNYPLGLTVAGGTTETDRYNLVCSNAGSVIMNICNIGTSWFGASTASSFSATHVASSLELGCNACGSKALYNNCIVTSDLISTAINLRYAFRATDLIFGAEIIDCLYVVSGSQGSFFGAETSSHLLMKNNILTTTSSYKGQLMRINRCDDVIVDNNVCYWNSTIATYVEYIVTSTNTVIKRSKISHSQNETPGTLEYPSIIIASNCSNVDVIGLEYLGQGFTGDKAIAVVDSFYVKVRAIGMLTEKITFPVGTGADAEELVVISGNSKHVDIARCWKTGGIIEEALITTNTTADILVSNCSGDYNSEIAPISGNGVIFRGLHGGSGSLGNTTTGIETDYPATYGSHFHDCFRSDTTGAMFIIFSPKTVDTNNSYTVVAGTPKFFKNGDVDMTVGDILEYEMQYFAKGHTSFTGVYTTSRSTGVSADGNDEWLASRIKIEFQYDTGAGYNGTWLDLRVPTNLTSITGMVGGIKLKVRFTCLITRNLLNGFVIHTTTTLIDQANNLYPIDQNIVTISVTVTDINSTPLSGVRVLLKKVSDSSIVLSGLTDVNGVLSTNLLYIQDEQIAGWCRKASFPPYYKQANLGGTITSVGSSLTAFMILDE